MKEARLYRMVRPLLKVFSTVCFRPTFIGCENIPKDGAFVLAGNHTNILDPVMLTCVSKRTIHFLAKYELTKGIRKIIFNHMGIIPVNRSIHDSNALKVAIDALNDGEVIGIFPEGTVNKGKETILPFKTGAVRMAKETSSLIVPFIIKGEYRLFRKGPIIKFYNAYKIVGEVKEENKKLMDIISSGLIKEK